MQRLQVHAFIGDVILGRYFALGNTCPVHLFLVYNILVLFIQISHFGKHILPEYCCLHIWHPGLEQRMMHNGHLIVQHFKDPL